VGLERQRNYLKAMPGEDAVSLLSDVAEWAHEVIPVQHNARTIPVVPLGDLAHLAALLRIPRSYLRKV
jgi:hypothetical protein